MNTLSIFKRVFLAFALTTTISVAVITLLSSSYFHALVARDQAIKVSFAAAATANNQLVNLERMNALLRTRLAQVFATTDTSLADPSLEASGGLINVDILTREIDFDQSLTLYQQTYLLATSSTMSGVRTIVLSDDPQSRVSTDQQAALTAVESDEWPKYRTLQDQVLQLLDPTANPTLLTNPHHAYEQAYALQFEANVLFLELKNDWQRIVDSSSSIGEIVTSVGPSQTQPIVVATSLALFFTILIIVLTGHTVNLTITKPLRQLAELTRRIARGETHARARPRGRDEIAQVATSMNTMLDKIVQLLAEAQSRGDHLQFQVEKLVHEVSGVGYGDLRVQADVTLADLGVLARSFNFMVDALSSLIIRVKRVSQQVAHSTRETSQVMSQLVESAGQQLAQMEEASTDVQRMASASQRTAERTADLFAVAGQARQVANEGAASVQQTVEGMGRIDTHVQATAQKVHLLEQRSSAITEISAFMGSIALRTNRLALDAAIQAKMAGVNGTGFAAVADDIRRLAEQAKTQATSIEGIVRTVQEEVSEVQRAMRETTHETERGAQLAKLAGMALAAIFAAVQRQADEIEEIKQVALDQVQVSAAVVQIMDRVSALTQRSSAHTQQAAQYLHQQGQLVAQLHTSVGAFQVRDERQGVSRAVVEQLGQGNPPEAYGPLGPSSGPLPTENTPTRVGVRPPQHHHSLNQPTRQHPSSYEAAPDIKGGASVHRRNVRLFLKLPGSSMNEEKKTW